MSFIHRDLKAAESAGKTKVFGLLLADKTTSSRLLARSLTPVIEPITKLTKKEKSKTNIANNIHSWPVRNGSDTDWARTEDFVMFLGYTPI